MSESAPPHVSSSRPTIAASLAGCCLLAGLAGAQPSSSDALPAVARTALARAHVPTSAMSVWVAEAGRPRLPRLAWQADAPMSPASVMKLVTSGAALDSLGPYFSWKTTIAFGGPLRGDVLDGPLYIRGQGDPRIVVERLWLMLSRVRREGVREIGGDIVLDRSAFRVPEVDPGAFDGERYRSYNVRPDALMLNQKTITLSLRPDTAAGVARVSAEPELAGVTVDATVPLSTGPCADWRRELGPDFSDATRVRLAGRYPAACGPRDWPVAYADRASYDARMIEAMWTSLGGRLSGHVRDGVMPEGVSPSFDFSSPPLADVLRDMNRFSNNVIAHQLFLTLGLVARGSGTWESARDVVTGYAVERAHCDPSSIRLDNGSGLSRSEFVTTHCLGLVLENEWSSPAMPELFASLPVAGHDTARRDTGAADHAHLKTGSLNGVAALAGVVHARSGRRYLVAAIINHPAASSDDARAALDAIVRWTYEDGLRPPRGGSTP